MVTLNGGRREHNMLGADHQFGRRKFMKWASAAAGASTAWIIGTGGLTLPTPEAAKAMEASTKVNGLVLLDRDPQIPNSAFGASISPLGLSPNHWTAKLR
jgi:hypothetical protein